MNTRYKQRRHKQRRDDLAASPVCHALTGYGRTAEIGKAGQSVFVCYLIDVKSINSQVRQFEVLPH